MTPAEFRVRVARERAKAAKAALDRNPVAKAVGGEAAGVAGLLVGLPEGGREAADDAAALAHFVGDLGGGKSEAWGALADGGMGALDYTLEAFRDPGMVARDVGTATQRANRDLNPFATPVEPTFLGELDRKFRIHRNQGNVVAQAAPIPIAGPVARRVGNKVIRAVRKPPTAADYRRRGYPEREAEYMARPYRYQKTHHAVARSKKVPERIFGFKPPFAGERLPRRLSDSEANYGRPEWTVTNGDVMEWHAGVDPKYKGGNMSNRRGDPGWSVEKLRMRRYGALERWLRGPTGTAKDFGWLVATTPPSVLYQMLRERRRERSKQKR